MEGHSMTNAAADLPVNADPIFEGFALQMIDGRQRSRARTLVRQVLGRGWRIRRFGDDPADFEVVSRKAALTPAEAWDATYRLRAQPGVVYAEPIFAVTLADRPMLAPEPLERGL